MGAVQLLQDGHAKSETIVFRCIRLLVWDGGGRMVGGWLHNSLFYAGYSLSISQFHI